MPEELTIEQKRQKKEERKRERELSDIRDILLKPAGRRFIWRVLEEGRIFYDAFALDSNSTYYNLGRQSISRLFLNELLEAKPDALSQMQQERDSEAESEKNIELKEQENKGPLD